MRTAVASDDDDFFVPDEPLIEVLAAFERGEQGVTAPRTSGSGTSITLTLE